MATRSLPVPAPSRTQAPPLRVVAGRKKKRRAAARRRSPIPVVMLVVLTVFAVAAIQAWVGQEGLRAAALEREVQQEQERLTLLRAKVAQLSSPQRLRHEAEKAGLVADPEPIFLPASVEAAKTSSAPPDATKRLATRAP